jgi:hypothetical protein
MSKRDFYHEDAVSGQLSDPLSGEAAALMLL